MSAVNKVHNVWELSSVGIQVLDRLGLAEHYASELPNEPPSVDRWRLSS